MMKVYKKTLQKVKPCVYNVWYVDEYGIFGDPIGEVGKYSELCKYDDFYVNFSLFNGVRGSQWVFYSLYYDIRVFDDYFSALRYARSLGSGE